ncbi:Protein GRAVITROPIC IN THE LIGHT 1 [Bienertia sinuspersici]
MAKKVTNFSDLIQRVTANCLLHPLGSNRFHEVDMTPDRNFHPKITHQQLKSTLSNPQDEYNDEHYNSSPSSSSEEDEQDIYEDARETEEDYRAKDTMQAYADLQEAHSPWDPEKMRVADAAVVAELRRMGVLRERFKRGGERKAPAMKAAETVAEVVAPYEAAVEELKGEVKAKEVELEELRQKDIPIIEFLFLFFFYICVAVPSSPTPDMFEATMKQVRETSKSFTSCLLSLMRAAQWDLSAAVRSIEAAISTTGSTTIMTSTNPHQHQTKHALESYVLRKIFQGFDHETFYMDGTLYSLLNPSQFRSECFSKYRDMKSMDPSELLGILPSSPFGVFCSKKYQEIVHPKMEESLFGNLDQRNQLLNGSHPRTQFYTEFLGLAKAVWLLHLLAFSLNPPPSHFEASRGAEFHSGYMESVVRYPGGKVPPGQIVGFPVSPGFKLGNGSVFKARVYLVPRK